MARQNVAATDSRHHSTPEAELDARVILLEKIFPGPEQPRTRFNQAGLEQLARSIKEKGVKTPLSVRPGPNGTFFLVGGERRWRAAGMAGLIKVPCLVRDPDNDHLIDALIDNIFREDLNPIDEAKAIMRLREERQLSWDRIAELIGKTTQTIRNRVRLLEFPQEIQDRIAEGTLPQVTALGLRQHAKERDIIKKIYDLMAGREPIVPANKREEKALEGIGGITFRNIILLGKRGALLGTHVTVFLKQDAIEQRRPWQKLSRKTRQDLHVQIDALHTNLGHLLERLRTLETRLANAERPEGSPSATPSAPPPPESDPPDSLGNWAPLPDDITLGDWTVALNRIIAGGRHGLSREWLEGRGNSEEDALNALGALRDRWTQSPKTVTDPDQRAFLELLQSIRAKSGCRDFATFLQRAVRTDKSSDRIALGKLS